MEHIDQNIFFSLSFVVNLSSNCDGASTPNSVMIPPVINSAGVTSNAGFQQSIPAVIYAKTINEWMRVYVGDSNCLYLHFLYGLNVSIIPYNVYIFVSV